MTHDSLVGNSQQWGMSKRWHAILMILFVTKFLIYFGYFLTKFVARDQSKYFRICRSRYLIEEMA